MEAFLVSIGVVALGEMGDKTQLLALLPCNQVHAPNANCPGHSDGNVGKTTRWRALSVHGLRRSWDRRSYAG